MKIEKRVDKKIAFGEVSLGDVFRTDDSPNGATFMRIEEIVNKDDSKIFNAVNIKDGCCTEFSYSTRVFIVDGTFVEGWWFR